MEILNLERVTKRYGDAVAVDGVSLAVEEGKFLALLGPSGCGKTTLLRLVAGFERPDAGTITLAGAEVAGRRRSVPPERRNVGMVFQSYALWPHMTVFQNVAYGLKAKRALRSEIGSTVELALGLVGLAGYEGRKPDQLSGGQRQRVAIARCLALKPSVVLLDEPLANLDANLRDSMRSELARMQRESGATFVIVTHDQAEAMSMADVVAVMHGGRVVQVGTPSELYQTPDSAMVASFIGQGVVVRGRLAEGHGMGKGTVELWGRPIPARAPDRAFPGARDICVRPRDLRLAASDDDAAFPSRVRWLSYQGHGFVIGVSPDADRDVELRIEVQSDPPAVGEAVRFTIVDSWVLPDGPGAAGSSPDALDPAESRAS